MPDAPPPPPPGRPLPPPAPPGQPSPFDGARPRWDAAGSPVTIPPARPPRAGELAPSWRVTLGVTWALVFLAYLAVWKASEEIGIATWWLGPRSSPQPIVVRMIPLVVAAVFGIVSSLPVRRLPQINLVGALVLVAIAVPDLSRAAGLAATEFAIAGAVALVAIASFSGRYRPVPADDRAG